MAIGAAILAGNVETVRWLLKSYPGIIVKARSGRLCTAQINPPYRVALPTYFTGRAKETFEDFCSCCTTPLSLACRVGNLELVKEMHTKHKMDLDANECSSLFSALASGNVALISYLLDNGVDATARNNFAFFHALEIVNGEMLKLLWKRARERIEDEDEYVNLVKTCAWRMNWGQTEMMMDAWKNDASAEMNLKMYLEVLEDAVKLNALHLVKTLLDYNIFQRSWGDVIKCAQELLESACKNGNLKMVEVFLQQQPLLLKFEDGHTCLVVAIDNGRGEIAKELIRKGANVNCSMDNSMYGSNSVLSAAVEKKMYDVATLLIDRGADANRDSIFILRKICQRGRLDLLKKLVENGCLYQHFIDSLVFDAAEGDHVGILEFFHQRGDDVFLKGTVLQQAISANSFEAVKFLCAEKLDEEDISKVWKSALVHSTSIEITRYLHNSYPFDETKHIKDIKSCVINDRRPVLEFLVERRVNFGEILKDVVIYLGAYSLDAIVLIAKVSDGWSDECLEKFYGRAFDEYHPKLLDHFERKLGEAAFFEKSTQFLKSLPNYSYSNHAKISQSMKYLLSKHYFCVPSFLNQCLRLACINAEIDLIKTVLVKGADANAFKGKLLTFAAASNRMDIWNVLLEHGADPSQASVLEGMKTLVRKGEFHLLPLLAKGGVDINELVESLVCETTKEIRWADFNAAWRETVGKALDTDE